jgi:hypothetical protein
VIAFAGLAVVGFAIFYLTDGREPRGKRAAKEEPAASDAPAQRKPLLRRPLKRPVSATGPATPDEEGDDAPEPTLDDARKAFDDYIVDLDREIVRLEKSGAHLTEAEWMKHRTRAADVIDGVLRRLDHKDPNMMIEIKDKQEAARTRLDALKPAAD